MAPAIDSAGRVVIPKAARDAASLRPGTRVRFRVESTGVLVEPAPLSVTLERRGTVVVAVPTTPVPRLPADEVDAAIDAVRGSYTETGQDP